MVTSVGGYLWVYYSRNRTSATGEGVAVRTPDIVPAAAELHSRRTTQFSAQLKGALRH